MNLSGDVPATTTTDSSGNYTFNGLINGSYTVTPSLTGHTFTPASISVTISGANQTGKNFTATAVTYSISGAVTQRGSGLQNVTMTLSGDASMTASTGEDGTYSFTDLSNGTYFITPSKTGYKFWPKSRSITVDDSDVSDQNFRGIKMR